MVQAPGGFVRGFHRLLSCSAACTPGDGHDPAIHEHHGRQQLLDEQAARRRGVVRTGPLAVDLGSALAWYGTTPLRLTPRQAHLLTYLASHVGVLCRTEEIVEAVWGTAELQILTRQRFHRSSSGPAHHLRVLTNRLRGGLGAAGVLIETIPGYGYRLRVEYPYEV